MVFHVGLELSTGAATAYNDETKTTFDLKLVPKNYILNFNYKSVLEDIKFQLNGDLGCICICSLQKNDNDFRRHIIESSLSSGFAKAEIIDSTVAEYFSAISQVDYIPKNDDQIWKINEYDHCEVWQIINGKAGLKETHHYVAKSFQHIIEKRKFDLLLVPQKYKRHMENIAFNCKLHYYEDVQLSRCDVQLSRCALFKARIMTEEPNLTGRDAYNILGRGITVVQNGKMISTFHATEKLPMKRSIKVVSQAAITSLKIVEADKVTDISAPKFKSFLLILNIDTNGIYDISFEKLPINPSISVDNYIEAVYYETQNYITLENDHTFIREFSFPTFKFDENFKNLVGIHSGNWKTSAAVWKKNELKSINLGENDGEEIIASYVQFDDEDVKCGQINFNELQYPSSSVYDIKTLIGKNLNEILVDKNWLFKVVDIQDGDSFVEAMQEQLGIKFDVGVQLEDSKGTVVKYPEEIYALLLKLIKTKADEDNQKEKLIDVIITVPGIYSESQKTTTRIAALLAGWQNIFLMPESIATLFANFLDFFESIVTNSSPIILMDHGHASINICILKIENDKIHILHNSSDCELGGREYDNLLFDYFRKQAKIEFGFDFTEQLWSRFIFCCKDIKHILSFRDSYRLFIEDFDACQDGYIEITRKHFQKLADKLLDKTEDFINETLKEGGFEASQISIVLQTGGGCRMPMIKLLLRQTFPKAKHYADDYPINTVAVGAVRYASTIKKESSPPKGPESSEANSAKEKLIPEDVEVDAVGIDLGTTRCCVAVNRKTGIETIGIENDGKRLLPSYVAYDEAHEKFGQVVVNRMRDHAKSTAFDAKRLLGKEIAEIRIDENWTFGIIPYGKKIKLQLTTHDGEALKYPEEISTALLKHIKEKTEQFQTKELSEVVITIPTAFNDKQKKSTHVAAILAGWKKVHLISETVAAALAYSVQDQRLSTTSLSDENSVVLVFDLGGGTLDVGIFKYKNNVAEIIGRSGDPNLGGRDFDKILIKYFTKKIQSDYGINVPESKKYFLVSKAQEIKENLSSLDEDSFCIDDIDFTKDGIIKITRTDFEIMASDLLAKSKEVIFKAINNSAMTIDKIEKVIQVGGGCRMPMIKQLVEEIFPNAQQCCVTNPDEVVAVGAAHYSFNLNSKDI